MHSRAQKWMVVGIIGSVVCVSALAAVAKHDNNSRYTRMNDYEQSRYIEQRLGEEYRGIMAKTPCFLVMPDESIVRYAGLSENGNGIYVLEEPRGGKTEHTFTDLLEMDVEVVTQRHRQYAIIQCRFETNHRR